MITLPALQTRPKKLINVGVLGLPYLLIITAWLDVVNTLPEEKISQTLKNYDIEPLSLVLGSDDATLVKSVGGFPAQRAYIAFRADFYFCRIELSFGGLTCVAMKSIVV